MIAVDWWLMAFISATVCSAGALSPTSLMTSVAPFLRQFHGNRFANAPAAAGHQGLLCR